MGCHSAIIGTQKFAMKCSLAGQSCLTVFRKCDASCKEVCSCKNLFRLSILFPTDNLCLNCSPCLLQGDLAMEVSCGRRTRLFNCNHRFGAQISDCGKHGLTLSSGYIDKKPHLHPSGSVCLSMPFRSLQSCSKRQQSRTSSRSQR